MFARGRERNFCKFVHQSFGVFVLIMGRNNVLWVVRFDQSFNSFHARRDSPSNQSAGASANSMARRRGRRSVTGKAALVAIWKASASA